MGRLNKGFTLIELLVVVLIIGILAAIALPQYQRVVEKTRMAEAVTNVRAIASANERYRMATGDFTNNINDLDVYLEGEDVSYSGLNRKKTQYFSYGAASLEPSNYIAVAQREPPITQYFLAIRKNSPNIICCYSYYGVEEYMKKLCDQYPNCV